MLQKNGVKVHLSNPKQTKAIAWAKVKNDKVDAKMLRKEIVLDYPHQEMKFYCLKIIDVLDEIIQIYDEKLRESEYKPEGLDLVLTLPNTGIVLETGPIEMFKSAKGYVSCCGLAPRTRESGGKIRQGGLSKEARLPLKYTYIEIANGRGK